MAKRHQFRCIEESGTTFDGMKTAKNIVQQVTITGILFQVDKLTVDVGEQIARLLQKVLQEVFHALEIAHANSLKPQAIEQIVHLPLTHDNVETPISVDHRPVEQGAH